MANFDTQSLYTGIEAKKKNIITFENAIQAEREGIKEYRTMIETIERKERESKRTITIKAEREA